MSQYAGVIHLGFIDSIDIPKMTTFVYTVTGVATPPQSLAGLKRAGSGQSYDIPLMRFEKPIMVPPLHAQQFSVLPGPAGDSRLEPISFLVGQCQDFTTNV